jgi:hypothetical protein
LKKTHDYLFSSGNLEYTLTFDFNDIATISILKNNVRNIKIINNVTHEKKGGEEYPKLINIRIINGRMKIINDTAERINPSRITNLLPFFIKSLIFNEKIPMIKHMIKKKRIIDKHIVANAWSALGSERLGKIPMISTMKAKIVSTKNITLETKYNSSNFLIIFGFSSILYALIKKYYSPIINAFGGSF